MTRHGKETFYVWRGAGHPKIRIRGEYGSPAFMAAYYAALVGDGAERKNARGSLSELIGLYQAHPAWTRLAPATRKTRQQILDRILRGGDMQASDIDADMIRATRDKLGMSQGKHLVQTLRGLFVWAVEAGHIEADPTEGVRIYTQKTDGYPTWTPGEIAAYRDKWPLGTRERLWLEVLLGTGMRRGDAVSLRLDQFKDGTIEAVAGKTRTPLFLPVLPELQEAMDAGPLGKVYVIESTVEQPFTPESFSVLFGKAARAAGCKGSAHGLRKAAATRLAEAGANVLQLNAAMGWVGSKMALRYTEAAERAALARQGFEKLKKVGK